MEERRKSKRTALKSQLLIKRLDSDEQEQIDIEIEDVSKEGIGFIADRQLEIGQVYEAYLTIWTKEVIHSFLRIVRIELNVECYCYGAVFVGMPEMDASRITVYQMINDQE